MIIQGFYVKDWYIEIYYNVVSEVDIRKAENAVRDIGGNESISWLLRLYNTGYTFTNFSQRATIMVISHATSPELMYDTIQHELKHVVEHISEYYNVNPRSEEAAYLLGEIARQMFPATAMVVCPRHHKQ